MQDVLIAQDVCEGSVMDATRKNFDVSAHWLAQQTYNLEVKPHMVWVLSDFFLVHNLWKFLVLY